MFSKNLLSNQNIMSDTAQSNRARDEALCEFDTAYWASEWAKPGKWTLAFRAAPKPPRSPGGRDFERPQLGQGLFLPEASDSV